MTVSEVPPHVEGDRLTVAPRAWPLALALGVAAGLVVPAITRAVETSRLAFGPYALSGNGALIVPAVLVPLALYALWTWVFRAPRPLASAVATAAGVWLGVALGTALFAYGSVAAGALISGALNGVLFVAVPALIAGSVVTVARSVPEFGRPSTLTGIVVAALPFGLLLPFAAMGVIPGAFVAASSRARADRVIVLGVLLVAVLLVASFAIPLFFL